MPLNSAAMRGNSSHLEKYMFDPHFRYCCSFIAKTSETLFKTAQPPVLVTECTLPSKQRAHILGVKGRISSAPAELRPNFCCFIFWIYSLFVTMAGSSDVMKE